jgi:hypothetical protein
MPLISQRQCKVVRSGRKYGPKNFPPARLRKNGPENPSGLVAKSVDTILNILELAVSLNLRKTVERSNGAIFREYENHVQPNDQSSATPDQ